MDIENKYFSLQEKITADLQAIKQKFSGSDQSQQDFETARYKQRMGQLYDAFAVVRKRRLEI